MLRVVHGALSGDVHARGERAFSIAWVLVLVVAVPAVLGRSVAVEALGEERKSATLTDCPRRV